ncbi:MAG: cell division protein ZapA [Deltaproteobacteria bacterium]|jgi:hypothetical protein|nr:cell division protein ZapA [Deltaproteobacteria bacterium]
MPDGQDPESGPIPGFEPPALDADGLVSLVLFGQKYHIRTDKPEMVFRLAHRVQSVLRDVQSRDPKGAAASGADLLVQAAFRLAMKLLNSERESVALKANIEALERRMRRLLDLVDGS